MLAQTAMSVVFVPSDCLLYTSDAADELKVTKNTGTTDPTSSGTDSDF
ncbi:hypothetical protein [Priestia megaterium]|nr:hypothetical protein [Priestia megaterium]